MGDNFLDAMTMDIDLNHEPSAPVLGFGSFLNDSQTTHNTIEERIRRLEAVGARFRERNRWRRTRNPVETNEMLVDLNANVEGSGDRMGMSFAPGRGCKRDSSHLVAKALAMEPVLFNCNICLEMAQEPILTCCGHLYCWSCFFQLPYVYSTMKECPVCRGEVTDADVIPIYGNGNTDNLKELESGLAVPPRPKANRVESDRQQRVSRGLSHIPTAELLRQIRARIGMLDQQSDGSNESSIIGSSQMLVRVLSESSASLSSQINNTQRIFENGDSSRRDGTFTGAQDQVVESTAEMNLPASIPSSSTQATDVSEIDMHALRSSFQRRFSFLRLSDIDSVVSHETRRRRLN